VNGDFRKMAYYIIVWCSIFGLLFFNAPKIMLVILLFSGKIARTLLPNPPPFLVLLLCLLMIDIFRRVIGLAVFYIEDTLVRYKVLNDDSGRLDRKEDRKGDESN